MAKKTKLLVYVDKDVMSNPAQLFDVAITHMIKKEVDIAERRQFIVEYQKAVRRAKDPIAVIHEWMQVRDVAGFPFRNKLPDNQIANVQKAEEKKLSEAGIRGAKAGKALREELNESKGPEGGVSVDDGADGKEVNGQTTRDGDDMGDGSGDTGNKRKRNK